MRSIYIYDISSLRVNLVCIKCVVSAQSGPGSSVGIATDHGLDGPGIESWWKARFYARLDRPWSPPSLLYNGYRVFPGVKCGRGVLLTTHPLLAQRPWKSRFIPLPPTGPQPDLQ